MTCSNCGRENPDEARFCAGCGSALVAPVVEVLCPSCGRENPSQARFCGACGSPLEEAVAPPLPVAPRPSTASYAGFWRRAGAFALDGIILTVFLNVVLNGLSGFLYIGSPPGLGFALVVSPWFLYPVVVGLSAYFGSFYGATLVVKLLILLYPWLYYSVFTGLRGQTPGKMVLGIKVVRGDGQLPGLGCAVFRETVGKTVSTIVLFLGFLWIALDRHEEGWHDKIAGTHVIRVR
ncbi:MAG: RDD family protein [Chloroflexi bacterium]|nr:RDD family protein [Chloroflexota bacterium]